MKNKKKTCIVFAVLVAALMLMTPTMARVTTEKTNVMLIDESQEILESLEIELRRNPELSRAVMELAEDKEVLSLMSQYEKAETTEEKTNIEYELFITITERAEYEAIKNYITQDTECSLCAEQKNMDIKTILNPENPGTPVTLGRAVAIAINHEAICAFLYAMYNYYLLIAIIAQIIGNDNMENSALDNMADLFIIAVANGC